MFDNLFAMYTHFSNSQNLLPDFSVINLYKSHAKKTKHLKKRHFAIFSHPIGEDFGLINQTFPKSIKK